MKHLEVKSFGPLSHADITFGDLTVLVGPQATGKSLLVQLVKAIRNAAAIRAELTRHGFDWMHSKAPLAAYCSLYFGGGHQALITKKTSIQRDGDVVNFDSVIFDKAEPPPGGASVFLIPAQRVLVLQRGWPQPFMSYSVGDPYAMRHFSDALRLLMEQAFETETSIFPHARRLSASLKRSIDDSIYIGAKLELETDGLQKRIVLTRPDSRASLPYLAWSAGQREFTPLLLGLYRLLPATHTRRGALETVIIEEPEMGLHPQAIVSFCLLALELLERKYRVIVTTHSPVVLDVVWALRQLQDVPQKSALRALQAIFHAPSLTPQLREIFIAALAREYKTYYFDRTASGVVTRDISTLDPGAEDEQVAGWGGLSGFSGRIAEIVGDALSRGRR